MVRAMRFALREGRFKEENLGFPLWRLPARKPRARQRARGFTLIELLVVIAIIATLLSIAVPKYIGSVRQAEEATLKQNLALMRDAIDKHFGDTGRYPDRLEDLTAKRYLRNIPVDSITGTTESWIVVPPGNPELGRVYDVKSGSTEVARDGSPLNTW